MNLFAQNLEKKILQNRLRYLSQDPLEIRLVLYNDLRVISQRLHQLKTHRTGCPPFHALLIRCSPTYRRITGLQKPLKIKMKPEAMLFKKLVVEFDPFMKEVPFPKYADKMQRLLLKQPSPQSLRNYQQYTQRLYSYFHELSHAVCSRLIIPNRENHNLDFYHYLCESLILVWEYYLAKDLGGTIAEALGETNTVYRCGQSTQIFGARQVDSASEFKALLLTALADIGSLKKASFLEMYPKDLPFLESPAARFKPQFKKKISPRWMKQSKKFTYPSRWRTTEFGIQKFELNADSVEEFFKSPGEIEKAWAWNKTIIFLNRIGGNRN